MTPIRSDSPFDDADDATEEDFALAAWTAAVADRIRSGEPVDFETLARERPGEIEELRAILPAISLMVEFGQSEASSEKRADPVLPELGNELGRLPDFQILRPLGRGGMGIVYEAEQLSLRRRVAIKVLPFALAIDPRRLQRFRIEAQAAALLHHPHIVPVFAVGCDRGVHYYAMQFIEGSTLADVIRKLGDPDDERRSPPAPSSSSNARGRAHFAFVARVGLQAADALEYAHRHGIVHRDVKPGNLMLDATGHLWVTDFGLARYRDDPGVTATGDVLGTLRYMSPEQALARNDVIDQRTDVYALGATLYELATLRPTFEGADRAEVLRRIAEETPVPLRRLSPAIPVDLETIILKCLEKDPSARYATAADLAADLGRLLDGRPIVARRPSPAERLARWARRRWLLVASIMITLGLVTSAVLAGLSWSNARLRDSVASLRIAIARADDNAKEANRQRRIAEDQQRLTDRHLFAARMRLARQTLDTGHLERAQEILDALRTEAGGRERPEFAWRYLWRQARREVTMLFGHDADVSHLAFSPDGTRLVTGDVLGTIRVWDPHTENCVATLKGHELPIRILRLSPDAKLASLGLQDDGSVPLRSELRTWDLATGKLLARWDEFDSRYVSGLEFANGGDRLVVLSASFGHTSETNDVRVYALAASEKSAARISRHEVAAASFLSPGGRLLAEVRPGQLLTLSDLDGGAKRWTGLGPKSTPPWPQFSRDGRYLAHADASDLIIRDVDRGTVLARSRTDDRDPVQVLVLAPSSASVASVARSGRVVVLSVTSDGGHPPELELRAANTVRPLTTQFAFSGDGTRLAFSGFKEPDGRPAVTIVDVASGRTIAAYGGRRSFITSPTFAPDGRSLYFASGHFIHRWRFDSPTPVGPEVLKGHSDEAWAVAFSPDGRLLASGSDDTDESATIKLWDAATGQLVAGWRGHDATVSALAFHPSGRALASASLGQDAVIKLWDVSSHRELAALRGNHLRTRSIAFSPNGRVLAAADDDGVVRLWEGDPLAPTPREIRAHTRPVRHVAFSPDGLTLASASYDHTVRLWDVATSRVVRELRGLDQLHAVAFAPDGKSLAATDEHGVITIWETATGSVLHRLESDDGMIGCLAFTPDGRTLAAGGLAKTIHLWDPVSGQELLSLEGHAGQIHDLAFSPDGSALASCSHDGAVWLWRASTP